MNNELKLSIILPAKVYLEEKVASVIIPAVRAEVDILPDRAPSVFVLDFGVLQILDRNGTLKKRYFIQSGVAEVADNHCKVMTQGCVPYDSITPAIAKKKVEEAENEQGRLFFSMILDYQRGVRRRYLRTLQLYSKKKKRFKTQKEVKSEVKPEVEELKNKAKAPK